MISVRPGKQFIGGVVIGMTLLVVLLNGCQDKTPTVYRVGVICGADFFLTVIDGFKARMTELGYAEGKTIVYDTRTFNADPNGERQAAETFVKAGVDLILSTPTQPSINAHAAIRGTGIPLVFSYAGIEGTDLVESVSHPGRNTTGLRFPGPEQICKRLEVLLEFLPRVKRVWIGYDKNYPTVNPSLNALRPLALSKGVVLVEVAADSIAEIQADLSEREKTADPGMDAIILMPDTFNHSPAGWDAIRTFAEKNKIPIGGTFLYSVEQGALFGTTNDLFHIGELTASLADKVLRGMPAGTIPIMTPEPVLIINYGVAEKLDVKVPEGMLNMASRIIR